MIDTKRHIVSIKSKICPHRGITDISDMKCQRIECSPLNDIMQNGKADVRITEQTIRVLYIRIQINKYL